MSAITTHVLDTSLGRPAAGVGVFLERQADDGKWDHVGRGHTDNDGRLRTLYPANEALRPGIYRLTFDTQKYFETADIETFYPEVVVVFETASGEAHYHVPLLLSPFGYSTYPENLVLAAANKKLATLYPGDPITRQPVHTFIGSGDTFTSDAAQRAGRQAIDTLNNFASSASAFAGIIGLPAGIPGLAELVRARVVGKLEREPIEDYRLDFEDGYGTRPDAEEDGHAASAAREVAAGMTAGTLPPFIGIRIKPLSKELQARSLRTLDIFVTTLVKSAKRLPPNFAVTATKVMTPAHVSTLAQKCSALEKKLKLRHNAIRLELMIETPQAILAPDGSVALPALVNAGKGRVRGAHFGVYDYTALCGITAAWQHPRHLACDVAREMMRVSLAQTGVMLSDGSSNILPIPPHVQRAWKQHFDDVTHSLVNGFYQGWDLHPGHLPTRYAAIYAFYLSARPAATARLSNFFTKAARAGAAFDDAATGQALVNFFNRGLSSGAITLAEAMETGLEESEFGGRSFRDILSARQLR